MYILKEYFDGVEWSEYTPKYQCLCSREYLEKILISLGENELNDILEKETNISTPKATFKELLSNMSRIIQGEEVDYSWADVYNWYIKIGTGIWV